MNNYEVNMQKETNVSKDPKEFSMFFSENPFEVLNGFISYSAVSAASPFPPDEEYKKNKLYDGKHAS